jgi:PAS domain S-box-containing protein
MVPRLARLVCVGSEGVSHMASSPIRRDHVGVTPQVAAEEELPPEATSAGRARALLRRALTGHEREDALDPAQLAVSEIVTNALVHAGTSMRLRILLAPQGLRVELADGSHRMPTRRDYGPAAGTGRGLLLVEELATRWGAYPLDEGKIVWFEISDDELLWDRLQLSGRPVDDPSVVVVELPHMPLLMHHAWQEHATSLLRELLLVRLDAELSALEEHASASDALALLAEQVPTPEVGVDADAVMSLAIEPAVSDPDLRLLVPRTSVPNFAALDVMLDEAMRLAEHGELLWPPTQPEIQAMRSWICEQVQSQAVGGPATAWSSLSTAPPPEHGSPDLDWDDAAVRASPLALLAADDANRILAVSRPTLDLLGYDDAAELVGRRLVTVIPERFHQAHIAGFTLHLVNGRSPLVGRRVTVPALRRDGTEVEVGLQIDSELLPEGRTLFTARFFA